MPNDPVNIQPGPAWRAYFQRGLYGTVPITQPTFGFYQGTRANTFEGGTSGTTITAGGAGNSGGVSGNPFDSVPVGGGGTAQFSSAQAAHGTLAALFQTTTGNATAVIYSSSMGPQSQVWFRAYLFFAALPGGTTRFFTAAAVGVGVTRFQVTTAGLIQVTNINGSVITTSATVIPLGQWFRVEGNASFATGAGRTEMKLYLAVDSATASEVNTSAATQNTGSQPSTFAFGPDAGTANQGPFYMDDVGLSSTGYLGPSTGAYPSDGGPNTLRFLPGQAWRTYFQPQLPRPQYQGDFAPTFVPKSLPATVATSGALQDQAAKTLSGTVATTGTVQDRASKTFAQSVVTTGALSRACARAFAVAVTATGALGRTAGKTLTATATTAGALTRQAGKALTVTAAATGALARQAGKTLAATATATGALARQAGKALAQAALTAAGLSRAAAKTLPATAAATPALTRQAARNLTATVTTTATGLFGRAYQRTFAVTVTTAGALRRAAGKLLSAVASAAAALLTAVHHNGPGTVSATDFAAFTVTAADLAPMSTRAADRTANTVAAADYRAGTVGAADFAANTVAAADFEP